MLPEPALEDCWVVGALEAIGVVLEVLAAMGELVASTMRGLVIVSVRLTVAPDAFVIGTTVTVEQVLVGTPAAAGMGETVVASLGTTGDGIQLVVPVVHMIGVGNAGMDAATVPGSLLASLAEPVSLPGEGVDMGGRYSILCNERKAKKI